VPADRKCRTAASSCRICSSKSENITTADAPWSSSRRIMSRFSESGEADATNGLLSGSPM
jgi:hypothetical protein